MWIHELIIYFVLILWLTIMIFLKMESLSFKKMDFEEFCAAAISPLQLEALQGWEKIATTGFEFFEQEGNRVTTVEELARVFKPVF